MPELDPVNQDISADVTAYLTAMDEIIAKAEEVATAVKDQTEAIADAALAADEAAVVMSAAARQTDALRDATVGAASAAEGAAGRIDNLRNSILGLAGADEVVAGSMEDLTRIGSYLNATFGLILTQYGQVLARSGELAAMNSSLADSFGLIRAAVDATTLSEQALVDMNLGLVASFGDVERAAAQAFLTASLEAGLIKPPIDEATAALARLDAAYGLSAAAASAFSNETRDALARLMAEYSILDPAAEAAMAGLVNGARQAAGAAGVAAGFWARWGGVIHWVIAGGAEFLAVAIPAMVAGGAAALVMAEGVQNVTSRLTAMYTAQEATANMLHQTVGNWLGMKSVLQQAQTAADPRVYELLGAGINIAKASAGGFVQEGTQVVTILDNFAAKITGEMQGAVGGQLHTLLSGGAKDLAEFGAVLGNVGHALLNLAGDMPGLAHVLLALLAGFTGLINWLSGMPAIIITVAMAFEEFWRWGGLAATIIASVLRWISLIPAAFMAATMAIANTARALIVAAAGGFADIIQAIGRGMVAVGTWITELGLASIAEGETGAGAVALGVAVSGAGARMVAFAAEIRAALMEMNPFVALVLLAGTVLLAFAIDKVLTAKTATQQFTASLQDAVEKANNLDVLSVISQNFDKLAAAEMSVSSGAFAATNAMKGTYDAGMKYGTAMQAAKSASDALSASQRQQQQDLNNTMGAVGFLEKNYGTTFVGAMVAANQAGVNLANGITGTGNAATVNRLKMANYMAGMQMMGQSATVAGHDVTMLGIDSQLSATKVGQLNQAIDQFVGNMTGGTSNLGGLVESIANIGKVTVTTADALKGYNQTTGLTVTQIQDQLTNFGQIGSQVWQNFDNALTGSGQQLADWFRTAGAEGAIGSGQFSQAMLDIVAQFTPFAMKSQNAQNELVGFAQAQGLNITSFPQLLQKIQQAGAGTASLTKLVGIGTKGMSDMNQVAQALAATVGTDVVNAMDGAKVAASGLGGAAQTLAQAWYTNHQITPAVVTDFQATYQALLKIYGNAPEARGAVDAFAKSLGLTDAQVQTLNGDLGTMQGKINGLHGKQVTIDVQIAGNGAQYFGSVANSAGGGGASYTVTSTGVYGKGASGGYIHGPGTKTSDSVPILASHGEYVVQAAAVDHYGRGVLDAINSRRFASGGVVDDSRSRSPSLLTAAGGDGGTMTLTQNQTFQVKLDNALIGSQQRTTVSIYNRRNQGANWGLRFR